MQKGRCLDPIFRVIFDWFLKWMGWKLIGPSKLEWYKSNAIPLSIMINNKYILSAPEASAIGVKRRYTLPALYEHFKKEQLREKVFKYKSALNKIEGRRDGKEITEKLTKSIKDFMNNHCIGWKDIVKREMKAHAAKKQKEDKPLDFEAQVDQLLSTSQCDSQPMFKTVDEEMNDLISDEEPCDVTPKNDLVSKYASQPMSQDNKQAISVIDSDEESCPYYSDSDDEDETKFTDNPKAWSKDTIKKQLVDNLSKMNQLVGDTLTLIDAMKE